MLSAAIYLLMVTIQSFDTPLAIGLPAGVPVLSTRIYLLSSAEQGLPRYGLAAAFGVVLLLFALFLMWGYLRATRVGEKFQVVTGRGYRPRRTELGRAKVVALAFVGAFFLLKALPFLILLWTSLLPYYQVPSLEALGSISLANYLAVTRQSAIVRALTNTLILIVASATLTMLLSTLISWFAVRSKAKAARWLEVLAFTPHTVPHLVMALALLLLYVRTPLYGTLWIIVLGHVIIYLPFASRSISSALMQVHSELEKAATVSGTPWIGSLRWVLIPLLWPHLVNGWLWVAAHSMRDLSMALMFITTSSLVISTALWRLWSVPDIPGTAALSTLLVLGLLAIVVPVQLLAVRATHGRSATG
jgi:iron(III) transport system permease protein